MALKPSDPPAGTALTFLRFGTQEETWVLRDRTESGMLLMDRGGEIGVIFNPLTFGLEL